MTDKAIASYQIHAAADQYFLEDPEKNSASYDDLIGPTCYVKEVHPADGENYHELFPIARNYRELALTMGDGRRAGVFDGDTLRQDADGQFQARYNRDPAVVENYRHWLAAGRPPATHQ